MNSALRPRHWAFECCCNRGRSHSGGGVDVFGGCCGCSEDRHSRAPEFENQLQFAAVSMANNHSEARIRRVLWLRIVFHRSARRKLREVTTVIAHHATISSAPTKPR